MRAVAVFLVIAWHFTHGRAGSPVGFEYLPYLVPFAILDEGHTGVALFMTLSGYLFARLLDGRAVSYGPFLRNRLLRLLPLLAVVLAAEGIIRVAGGQNLQEYARQVLQGAILPTLPNGAWSITAELHFYVALPVLLWLLRRSTLLPLVVVLAAIALRAWLRWLEGSVESLAYLTIIGRIDQFVLGMLAWHLRGWFARRHLLAAALLAAFSVFYWVFDEQGGLLLRWPSPDSLWIYLSTIEGAVYASLIAWYDNSFRHSTGGVSRFIGRIGEYSYSIYLLHFFFVFAAAQFVHRQVMDLSNFYVACLWSVVFLVAMMPLGYLSFRFIEAPFLLRRKRYIVATA